jgi:predicted phosphodiesterase
MRVFAVSDIHVDYDVNARWIAGLSTIDYRDDVLILAGDVTDDRRLLGWCLSALAARFRQVVFVPGNHDLWVIRDDRAKHSLQKFADVCGVAASSGVSMRPYSACGVAIVPLLSWYDYSFGEPSDELRSMWMDYRACRWPDGIGAREIAAHFAAANDRQISPLGATVITYSHFVPRIEVMPAGMPGPARLLLPILGSAHVERQLRRLDSRMHVYGHSHLNRRVTIDGVAYINNAFGYPGETWLTTKDLLCIHEC